MPSGVKRGMDFNGSAFRSRLTINAGGSEAMTIVNMTPRIKLSIRNAAVRSQNPAYAGRACTAADGGSAGIVSGGWALCGTYTGPICATLTGSPHCGQKLAPS